MQNKLQWPIFAVNERSAGYEIVLCKASRIDAIEAKLGYITSDIENDCFHTHT